jgi:hypothetical protein
MLTRISWAVTVASFVMLGMVMLAFHSAYKNILIRPELISASARPEDFVLFVVLASTQSNFQGMVWFRRHSSGKPNSTF